MDAFSWMAWTPPVVIFFACVATMLTAMTIWELRSPTIARKGWLPIVTTRGDRLFIGLLAAAYINLMWAGLTDLPQWWGGAVGFAVLIGIMKWG